MTQLTKFFPTTKEVQDIVIWVDDMEDSINAVGLQETLDEIMDRVFVGDLKCPGYVHVIDDNKELATNMAHLLDEKYQKEMELMKNVKGAVKEEEKTVVVGMTDEEKAAVKIAGSDAAQRFMAKHGDKVKKAEEKKEEVEVKEETKKASGNRRRLSTATAQEEVKETAKETKTNEKVETEMNKPNRKSTSRVLKSESKKAAPAGNRKKLARSESIKPEFVKFEGPWYLNSSLYEVLGRMDQILENIANGEYVDAELGIEQIVFVEPENISRYQNRDDLLVVIQIKANGNIMEFPIKEASANSNADLSSSSIGWIELKNGGMRPAFGHYKMNAQAIEAKCTCGHEFHAHPENVYCEECGSLFEEIDMTNHKQFVRNFVNNNKFQVKKVFEFVTAPNLVVPRETLALVMALAQYDQDFDMWGVIAE